MAQQVPLVYSEAVNVSRGSLLDAWIFCAVYYYGYVAFYGRLQRPVEIKISMLTRWR